MSKITEEQVESIAAGLAGALGPGCLPTGFSVLVEFLGPDGEATTSTFTNGFSPIQRMGAAQALMLEAQNLWQLPYCPWQPDEE